MKKYSIALVFVLAIGLVWLIINHTNAIDESSLVSDEDVREFVEKTEGQAGSDEAMRIDDLLALSRDTIEKVLSQYETEDKQTIRYGELDISYLYFEISSQDGEKLVKEFAVFENPGGAETVVQFLEDFPRDRSKTYEYAPGSMGTLILYQDADDYVVIEVKRKAISETIQLKGSEETTSPYYLAEGEGDAGYQAFLDLFQAL